MSLEEEPQTPCNHKVVSMHTIVHGAKDMERENVSVPSLFLSHWARFGVPTFGLLSLNK